MDSVATNSFQTLNKEDRRERPATDFVRNVALAVFDANRRELVGQIGVAKIPAF
jgi:hypothetical protein